MENPLKNNRNVLDFVGRHKEEQNKLRRKTLGVTADDHFLYPDRKVVLSSAEAVDIAQKIISGYDNPTSPNFGEVSIDFDRLKVADFEKMVGENIPTERLVSLVELHKNNPRHFAPEYQYAIAKELLRRLDPDFKKE